MPETIYCVYATTYSGPKMPILYIGSSTVEKVKNGYHGSVSSKKWGKIWKQELKEHPEYFLTHILMCYSTRKEALRFELECQKEIDAVNNPACINESYAQIDGFFGRDVSGENNPMFGLTKENSEIVKQKSEKISILKKKLYEEFPEKHPNFGKPGWNAGLTKETNSSVAAQANNVKEFYNSDEGKLSLEQGRRTRAEKDVKDPSRLEKRNEKYKIIAAKRLKLNDQERQQVIDWFEQGYSRSKIVELLDNKVSITPICTIINKHKKLIHGEHYDTNIT